MLLLLFWVCFLLCDMYFQPKTSYSWKKGVQQPNPSKPHSSEEGGPKFLCDAVIHPCPWLAPGGKQFQTNRSRAPFLSKLYHIMQHLPERYRLGEENLLQEPSAAFQ